jgi:hypothetical protein
MSSAKLSVSAVFFFAIDASAFPVASSYGLPCCCCRRVCRKLPRLCLSSFLLSLCVSLSCVICAEQSVTLLISKDDDRAVSFDPRRCAGWRGGNSADPQNVGGCSSVNSLFHSRLSE